MVLKFCFKIVLKFFLQVIAVKEQCFNFSNDSMLFVINFRDLKKRGMDVLTDGPTDGPTDRRTDRRTDEPKGGQTDPYIEMRGRILKSKSGFGVHIQL